MGHGTICNHDRIFFQAPVEPRTGPSRGGAPPVRWSSCCVRRSSPPRAGTRTLLSARNARAHLQPRCCWRARTLSPPSRGCSAPSTLSTRPPSSPTTSCSSSRARWAAARASCASCASRASCGSRATARASRASRSWAGRSSRPRTRSPSCSSSWASRSCCSARSPTSASAASGTRTSTSSCGRTSGISRRR